MDKLKDYVQQLIEECGSWDSIKNELEKMLGCYARIEEENQQNDDGLFNINRIYIQPHKFFNALYRIDIYSKNAYVSIYDDGYFKDYDDATIKDAIYYINERKKGILTGEQSYADKYINELLLELCLRISDRPSGEVYNRHIKELLEFLSSDDFKIYKEAHKKKS